jgi:hypothetical protein
VFLQTWFSCITGAKKHHFTAFVKGFFMLKKQGVSGLVGGIDGGKLNRA